MRQQGVSVFFFLGVKSNFYGVKNHQILPVKKNYAREKSEKTLKKCAWKSLFARENFRQITPVKAKLTGVKNIENYTRETGKSAREKLWAEICAKIDKLP